GWIDKTGAQEIFKVLSTKTVAYAARVIKPWSINTAPWGTADSKLAADVLQYINKPLEVTKEKVTERGTYALLTQNGKEIGWIDKTGLDVYKVLNTRQANYSAKVLKPWSITTLPWGTEGYKVIQSAHDLIGKTYRAKREANTQKGTYV